MIYRYKVGGGGYFPIDMLRCDQAHPSEQHDSRVIELMMRGRCGQAREIELISDTPPNERLWNSFGFSVLKIEAQEK